MLRRERLLECTTSLLAKKKHFARLPSFSEVKRLRNAGPKCLLLLVLPMLLVAPLAMNAQRVPLPDAPQPVTQKVRPADSMAIINGRPYKQPTRKDLAHDYAYSIYGPWGITNTTVRALYGEIRDRPSGWGQDAAGFGQRFGSAAAVTGINATVRYGMENVFREDLRFIPCHGCTALHKIENVLLSEVTARHESDGHRFFTLTPTIADFSGPIITHELWYPGASSGPLAGVVASRTVFVTRIGLHALQEFVLERKHHDVPERGPHSPEPTEP